MVLISALNGFHSYADWKASAVDKNIQILFQRKAENDQLRAEYEELKRELNVRASERAQREVHKKEVCVCIYSL
jgi:cell division protein FtsB